MLRGAIEHEYCERTLHGTFMEATPLLQHLGLGKSKVVPGFPQLMRPCKVCRQAVTFREGTPLVMVSQQKKALAVARASFGNLANAPG